MNCTTTSGKPCVFPFIANDKVYTACTTDGGSPPWCSTKVDAAGYHVSGQGQWGNCSATCPSNLNTGLLPACKTPLPVSPLANLSVPFPTNCSARLNRTTKNILFLGNSYTYVNDLPAMLTSLARAAGYSMTSRSQTPGGQTLAGHVSAGVPQGDWDVVVIQAQSQEPAMPTSSVYYSTLQSSRSLVATIRKQNVCTVPVFYQTWGRLNGDTDNCPYYSKLCTYDGMQDRLTDSYSTFAYVNQPAAVAPVGEAFRLTGAAGRKALYQSDNSHPSTAGTYLAACTLLETIWGRSCVGNSYQPVGGAQQLQATAHQAVKSRSWVWPQQPGGPPCLACVG